ncbi:hypothetical protein KTO58_02930 [Chitinophaga pendula]|uniref:hypothetical protein n=1 Tax=Chitinophaga TaxID=79328 RepID=UPI000BAF8995|nr:MULTISPECIES: hypothetical protein [Chitinophaga]ASZ14210.1 hypothetical protein CK934_26290 [Chitinophaga sp. MD30]UCJ08152.1 hypothetical protein KTO58_02930 [Chitinophaga pendula]
MAKQRGPITFSGNLYDVIGYRRNGKFFARSRPTAVRQTRATRKAAQSFGAASRKGRLIRHTLLPLLDLPYDGSLVNRLNKALITADHTNTIPCCNGNSINTTPCRNSLPSQPPAILLG